MQYPFMPAQRLHHAREFDQVFNQNVAKVHQTGFMLLAFLHPKPDNGLMIENELTYPQGNPSYPQPGRLGLVIAKRKIRRAHERNRVKRIARESFRLQGQQLAGLDIILMAKSEAQTLSNAELHGQLSNAWNMLRQKVQRIQSKTTTTP